MLQDTENPLKIPIAKAYGGVRFRQSIFFSTSNDSRLNRLRSYPGQEYFRKRGVGGYWQGGGQIRLLIHVRVNNHYRRQFISKHFYNMRDHI